jgi:hypothetical protein
VFNSEDPVRAFRQFAALNLISQGRAEIIVVVAHSSSTIPSLDLISKAASKSTSRLTEYRPRLLSPNFASWCPWPTKPWLSAVTQNQPVRVEIKGVKTGHCLGVKTALVGLVNAGPEGHVECPESEPSNDDIQFSRSRMVSASRFFCASRKLAAAYIETVTSK